VANEASVLGGLSLMIPRESSCFSNEMIRPAVWN
jgi:hypothetical protein